MNVRCTLVILLIASRVAWADDSDDDDEVVVVEEPPPTAHHEVYFRVGYAFVDPRVTSGGVQLQPTALAAIAAGMPPSGGISTDGANQIAGIIGWAPKWFGGYVAVETIVGIPQKTHFHATGALATQSLAPSALGVPTGIPPLGNDLGEAEVIPPMLTVVARTPEFGPLRFYGGVGASVLLVTDAKITNPVLTAVGQPKFEVSPEPGVVLQAGVDARIYGSFFARLDIKAIYFETAESTISNIRVHTQIPFLETVDVGSAKSDVTAQPIIVQAGVGLSF